MDRKRLLRVTAGNLRQNHLYIREHIDFFPPEAVGPAKRIAGGHAGIELILDGLDLTIETDIGRDAKTGQPRGFLRDRRSIGMFYKHHRVTQETLLELERLDARKYRLSVVAPDAQFGFCRLRLNSTRHLRANRGNDAGFQLLGHCLCCL